MKNLIGLCGITGYRLGTEEINQDSGRHE